MRKADQMINMVTGETVVVTAINDSTVTFDNGMTLDEKKVKACFKFVGNDTPYETPNVEVNGANVLVDGERVETGIMKPISVVATLPGAALLLAKGDKEKKNLVRYDAARKRFNRNMIAEGIDDAKVLYDEDGVLIYTVITQCDRKIMDEKIADEKIVKDYADTVFVVKNGEVFDSFHNQMLGKMISSFVADDGRLHLFFERTQKLKALSDVEGYEFFSVTDMDGVDLVEVVIVDETDEESGANYTYALTHCSHYGGVKRVSQIHGGNGVMVVSKNGIHIFGRHHMAMGSEVLSVAEDYPTLVRFTAAGGSRDYDTFVLANEEYETCAIRVRRVGGPVGYVTEISRD